MAEHNPTGQIFALTQSPVEKAATFFITQVKVRTGVRVGLQQSRIMVGFHVDEVGILKPAGDAAPIPEVRGDYNLFPPASFADGDLKTKSLADPIVGHPEGMDGKVADQKRSIKKGTDFEV
jgi:hypothetical protein